MNEDNCVRLEKIQGGVDLINERLKHANELQNERHDQLRTDIARLDAADVALDGRVTVLETDKSERKGERKGFALSGRLFWAAIGFIPPAIVAGIKLAGL